MSVIIILLAASVLISGGFLLAFFWASHHGQFDDLETPPERMLFDAHTNKKEDAS